MHSAEKEDGLIINFRRNLLDDSLLCTLCNGYFNFAHTLVDCGHTFCRMCIYSHFKKSKDPKCPTCDEKIEKNFSKSVRKDPYKQSLVDMIHPEFAIKDHQIIKRCKDLFPDFDIQTIKDELDSSNWETYPKKKRKEVLESKLKNSLNDTVFKVLKMNLDTFSKHILDDDKYRDMQQLASNHKGHSNSSTLNTTTSTNPKATTSSTDAVYIHLQPKTHEDYQIVGIKNIISLHQSKNPEINHLKKFIVKQLQEKYKDTTPPYNASKVSLDGIVLTSPEHVVYDSHLSINKLNATKGEGDIFIFYDITFKNH